jgi:hypothetical protein
MPVHSNKPKPKKVYKYYDAVERQPRQVFRTAKEPPKEKKQMFFDAVEPSPPPKRKIIKKKKKM